MCKQGKITLLGGSTEIERDILLRSTAGHIQESSPGPQQTALFHGAYMEESLVAKGFSLGSSLF